MGYRVVDFNCTECDYHRIVMFDKNDPPGEQTCSICGAKMVKTVRTKRQEG